MHLDENLLMIGAVGIGINGEKHPLIARESATENAKVVQALLENLINLSDRHLALYICRLFVVDGAKALSIAIRRNFGSEIHIQRCQVQKARHSLDRLPPGSNASVHWTLRQAWEHDDRLKAARLIRNLAQQIEP
jgi:transposase-like protein